MRIAWYSNPPWDCSGYGVQTKLFVPRLRDLGHDVCIIANCHLGGASLTWNGVQVYPYGFKGFDPLLIAAQIADFKADVVISLFDAWALSPEMFPVPWVPWFPMDREPRNYAVCERIEKAHYAIAMTEFGKQASRMVDMECGYVPHAVCWDTFLIRDRSDSRRTLGLPNDAMLFGVVADNKGWPTRKAIAQQIHAFSESQACRRLGACLYLHTHAGTDRGGLNLSELINHLGIQQQVFFCDQQKYQMGFSDDYMVNVYNSIDCLLNVSMDEGFGVPIIEAQACGTPVICGSWTGMGELCKSGYLVPRGDAEPHWNPTGGWQFLVRINSLARLIDIASREIEAGFYPPLEVRKGVSEYCANHVTEHYWSREIVSIEERLTCPTAPIPVGLSS